MVNESVISGVGDVGSTVGYVTGKGAGGVANFFSEFSLYIANMGLFEWVLLFILGIGGFIVWHLKNKYGLKFSFSPKKPKKTFN